MKKLTVFVFLILGSRFALGQCTGVSVSSQPQNQTVTVGNTAFFSVGVSGTGPFLYFWYKNNSQIPGATSSSYTTPSTTSADNGSVYKCIITNCSSSHQAISNNATLTVNSPCTAVSISSALQNQTVTAGNAANFSVSVNGTGPFLYFWYKNNVQIPGASSSSYTTPPTVAGDNGSVFKCIAQNCNNTFQATSSATLTVNTPCTAVSISSPLQNQTVTAGNTATFSINVNGTGPFLYFWFKNNVQIAGASSSTYTTLPTVAGDNGSVYECKAQNCNNTYQVSSTATLTVNTPCTAVSISSPLQNQTVTVGNTATFSINVNGTGPFLYFWFKNNVQIAGASSSTYTTLPTVAGDNGSVYECKAQNCNNTYQVSSTATLTVNSPCTAVSISSPLQNQTVSLGNTATFSINVNGTGPFLYFWFKNNVQIPGASSSTYTTPPTVAGDNGSVYECKAQNCNNTYQVSSTASLTVNTACTGVIVNSQPQNQVAGIGTTATFSISVNGSGPFQYFWYKNGSQIAGANAPTYTTSTLNASDNGSYFYCLVTNCNFQNGTSSINAYLTVTSTCIPVTISAQPQNQTAAPTSSTVFSLSTAGTLPVYQWQYSKDAGTTWNNVPANGSYNGVLTPALTVSSISFSITGYKYRCMIGGNCTSSFYSNVVSLSVQSKLWINKPTITDKFTTGQVFQISWGDFVTNTLANGNTGFVNKHYKIELSSNNGISWTVIKNDLLFPNAISGQNNNNFNTSYSINAAGTYKIRIIDIGNPSNFNVGDPFQISTIASDGFKIVMEWDKSSPKPSDKPNPIGLASDGIARILLTLVRQPTNSKNVTKIKATIKPSGESVSGTALLGKILHATSPEIYGLEANSATSVSNEWIANQSITSTSFWLVAPDDFTSSLTDQRKERKINVEFLITYDNSTSELISTTLNPITITRPPLLFVHGLNGNASTFETIKYEFNGNEIRFDDETSPWRYFSRINLIGNAAFDANAKILLGLDNKPENFPNTFQYLLNEMHKKGFANNRVDYICHSMGGCVARTVINNYSGFGQTGDDYKPSISSAVKYKNYGKGFINKLITINSPLNGSLIADLTVERYWKSIHILAGIITSNDAIKDYFDGLRPSAAIKNLQALNGGVRFKTTYVKNHLIGSDIDKDNQMSESDILTPYSDYKRLFDYLLPKNETVKHYFSQHYSNSEYLNNTDIVVPDSSQFAGKDPVAIINISTAPAAIGTGSIIYGIDKQHIGRARDIEVGTRVMRLLNAPISSGFFADEIPANNATGGDITIRTTTSIDTAHDYFDTSLIKIAYPKNLDTVFVDSIVNVQVRLKDTSNFQDITVAFQNSIYTSVSNIPNQSFAIKIGPANIGKNILYAQASYDSSGYTINHIDTIRINVIPQDTLKGFFISPKSQILNPGQKFEIKLNTSYTNYNGFLNLDDSAVSFTILDTNVVVYEQPSYKFIVKDTGTTHILFSYGIYTDTAFIYVSTGSEVDNKAICPGQLTSLSAGQADSSKLFQWQVDDGTGFIDLVSNFVYSGVNTNIMTITGAPTSYYGYKYRCIIYDSIGSNITPVQTLKFSVSWLGLTDNIWETPSNWSCGVLPDSNTDVIINSGAIFYPTVNSNTVIRSLITRAGSTVQVAVGTTLTLAGQ